jgi:hypothetical protein
LIDGASNTFRLRAEIPNEDLEIPSGVRCKAELPDPPGSAKPPAVDPYAPPPAGALKLTPQKAPAAAKATPVKKPAR